jgi:tellurite resistance protein TehA-like permease
MATGIVSTAAWLLGVPWLARALLGLNAVLYLGLVALSLWRLAAFPARVGAQFASHARGPGFLTAVAGTCVLGSQVVVVAGQPRLATALWGVGVVLWAGLLYPLLFVLTVRVGKPAFDEGLNGGWMLIVVATQSISVLGTLVAPTLGVLVEPALAFTLAVFLLGALLYVVLLALVLYRVLFFPLGPAQLTPPYWITMGAVAITTLAGALLVLAAERAAVLRELGPFLKGMTVMAWAMASWWLPLLLLLGAWRHLVRRVPLHYDVEYWSLVFPLGMYTAATIRVADAIGWTFLRPLARVTGAAALVAWALTFAGLLHRLRRRDAAHPGGA